MTEEQQYLKDFGYLYIDAIEVECVKSYQMYGPSLTLANAKGNRAKLCGEAYGTFKRHILWEYYKPIFLEPSGDQFLADLESAINSAFPEYDEISYKYKRTTLGMYVFETEQGYGVAVYKKNISQIVSVTARRVSATPFGEIREGFAFSAAPYIDTLRRKGYKI